MNAVASSATELAEWRDVPVLAGLSPAEWQPLAEFSRVIEFADGEWVLHQGGQGQNLWIVLEGTAEVVRQAPGGVDVVLAELAPHSQFGEMSFFQAVPHSASVRAKGPLRALKIARTDFDQLVSDGCCGAYKVAVNVVASLADRLRRMDEWVAQLVESHEAPPVSPAVQPSAVKPRTDEWARFRDQLLRTANL